MQGTDFRDSKGIYTWVGPTGAEERFPSVTTILKCLDKPALPRWAAKSVAEFVKAICEKRNRGEMTGQELMDQLMDTDTLKQTPWTYAEKKRDMGSTFHSVAEQITLGTPVSASVFGGDVKGYIESLLLWLQDERIVEFEASEFACFNREVGYAGTADNLHRRKDDIIGIRLFIGDWKTSPDSYIEHALQLAAYAHAEFIGLQDGTEEPMPKVDGACIILPQADGTKAKCVEWAVGDAEFKTFCALKQVYDWQQSKPKYREVL